VSFIRIFGTLSFPIGVALTALGHVPPALPTIYFFLLFFGAIRNMTAISYAKYLRDFAYHSYKN